MVEQTLSELLRRLRSIDPALSVPLLQRWAQQLELTLRPGAAMFSFEDVAADIRQRAGMVVNEQQLHALCTQILQGLEAPPQQSQPQLQPSAAQPDASFSASASAGAKPGITSAQISDMIQQLKSGKISQAQLYSQLSGLYNQQQQLPAAAPSASQSTPSSVPTMSYEQAADLYVTSLSLSLSLSRISNPLHLVAVNTFQYVTAFH